MKKVTQQGIIYGIIIILFLALLTYITVHQGIQISELAKNPVKFKAYLEGYGLLSILVFMGLQTLQVLAAAIPGELLQLAGGYAFGTWAGAFYSVIGISLGSTIAFFIARLLGYPVLKMFVSPKALARYDFMINSHRTEIIIFILFFIPGLPKDILSYLAGITPVKAERFILSSTIARFPGILASSYIGANLQKQNLTEVIIASVIVVIVFALGVIYRERLVDWGGHFSSRKRSHSD